MTSWWNLPSQIDVIIAMLKNKQGVPIMDILDTIMTEIQAAVADAQTLIADFKTAPTGMISVTDPRFAQLEAAINGMDANIKAALPPAVAPVTPATPAPAA